MKMKSAYELAMERLQKDAPNSAATLSEEQKQALADIDTRYQAKIAERDIFLNKQLQEARAKRDGEAVRQIEAQLRNERARLQDEREAKKEQIRKAAGA